MVDYSKWKNIEISDDEDDTHPNIDTPSLFRWRHQARVQRMEEMQKEKEELEKKKKAQEETVAAARQVYEKAKQSNLDMNNIKEKLAAVEKELKSTQKDVESLQHKEKMMPWNVDTISKEGFSKTVINNPPPLQEDNLTEEERHQRMQKFVKENEPLLKQYGMFRKYDDSKQFLMEHPHLACDDTANYLVIWCINLEMEGKRELMTHVAHQCICMQYILELSKQLKVDPRGCVPSFFSRIQVADKEYRDGLENEIAGFIIRIKRRAKEKLNEALHEAEEEEKKARLGPGGLDPVEVFDSLPVEMQSCFEDKDIPGLQMVISKMSEADARYHMQRCVDSGLWIPDAKEHQKKAQESEEAQQTEKGEKKPVEGAAKP